MAAKIQQSGVVSVESLSGGVNTTDTFVFGFIQGDGAADVLVV